MRRLFLNRTTLKSKRVLASLIVAFFLGYLSLYQIQVLRKTNPTNTATSPTTTPLSSVPSPSKNYKRTQRRLVTAYDGGGFGTARPGMLQCPASLIDIDVKVSRDALLTADFAFFHMNSPKTLSSIYNSTQLRNHYTMVFTMESEVHSYGGDTWSQADFRMW